MDIFADWNVPTKKDANGKEYEERIQLYVKKTDTYVFEVLANCLSIGKVQIGIQDISKSRYFTVYVNANTFLAVCEGISLGALDPIDIKGISTYYKQQGGTSKWRSLDIFVGQKLPYTVVIKEGEPEKTETGGTKCKQGTMVSSCYVGLTDMEARTMASVCKAVIAPLFLEAVKAGDYSIFGQTE